MAEVKLPNKTLVFLVKPHERQVLLAQKKRGFGVGKWNGVGGKVERGESIEDAAVRETLEEVGVTLAPNDLHPAGLLTFRYAGNPAWDCFVHVFLVEHFSGVPTESEEMAPQWFAYDALPFEEMWEDDRYWLPRVLAGETVTEAYVFDVEGRLIVPYGHRIGTHMKSPA